MGRSTHEIVILDRKPAEAIIRRMVFEYFESEAALYDRFNASAERRRDFIDRMDDLIAADLKARPSIDSLLSIACGTGFRENDIRSRSGRRFVATGVDVSPAMCEEARRAGLEVIESAWGEANLGERLFDAGMYLYSLGLVPSRAARLAELAKIARHLKRGAPFYVDVLNLDDRNEWGPELRQRYAAEQLVSKGYELGDTFYRRIGSDALAYYHYFERQEAEDLLGEAGFEVAACHYIDCGNRVGALVGPDEGAVLFITVRR